jgi:hypothetical protein
MAPSNGNTPKGGGGDFDGGAGPAINAWNILLGKYGYA